MCDEPTVVDRDEPVVGVLETDGIASDLVESVEGVLESRDGTVVCGPAETVRNVDPDLLVAVGTAGVAASVTADLERPVLPVGSVTGLEAVTPSNVESAVESALDGSADVESRDVLEGQVVPDGDDDGAQSETDSTRPQHTVRGCFDVTLDTDEPARISEFSVSTRGETVAAFRADGVVVATAAGSHGYAANVGSPALSRAVDAVTVAPIAPFATRPRRWVLPPAGLRLTVERDECTVDLVVDGRPVTTLENGWSVTLRADRSLPVVVPDRGLE
ncbi:NAD(+)/NADH kinase [Natrarchaeobaculum aegyptiacum]|uniref:ATP-NAD kinase n=1 Tax=Natrarchaeobaculum aegyptiacum TaxID=745377 RepID=A0A2Z2I0H6_9EURY|nr:NAD(+)/NADH kinase [Natrarchaeobaculum aegyptiacum]ARS91927.1 hypothetical protein B1756_17990 [Natrarchaeobaculum aegyptiacum]